MKLSYISLGNTALRAEKWQAEKQSCLKEHISGYNIALEPTGVQSGPWRVGCGILEIQGEEGVPAQEPRAVVTGSSFRDMCLEKSFIPWDTCWVYLSCVSHELWPGC